MALTLAEQERADKTGRRHGATFDCLYDSTPPVYVKAISEAACKTWRQCYKAGFDAARGVKA